MISSTRVLHPWQKILLIFLLIGVITGLIFVVHSFLERLPVGADFYTFWLAARANFIEHQNPYSNEVTLASQVGIYGRPAFAWEDQVAFAYPPYSLFLLLPLSGLTYPWAESVWLIVNIILIISAIYLSFPKAPKWLPFTFLLFYPVAFGLILGNFVITISAFLIFFYGFFVARKNPASGIQILTGILLAWSTTKPQFMWLFLVFILLIAFQNKYRIFFISLVSAWIVFFLLSFLAVPGWLPVWISRIQEYAGYVKSSPTLLNLVSFIIPAKPATGAAIVLGFGVILVTVWMVFKWFRKEQSDLHLFIWFGFTTYLFHPHGISYEQLSILVPLLCWVASLSKPRYSTYSIFWFLPLILSWGFFAISKWIIPAADELPLLYFGLIFGWILLSKNSSFETRELTEF